MIAMNKSDVVRQAAKGRWLEILAAIAPDLTDATKNCPKPVLDPVNGTNKKGKKAAHGDGFRLFEDANDTGGGVSNTDGFMPNGFEVLMWATKSSFKEILTDVADYLKLNKSWKNVQPRQVVRSKSFNEAAAKTDVKTLEKRRYALRRTWKESYELHSPQAALGRKYFASRGINLSDVVPGCLRKTMRFHPALAFWHDDKMIGRFPAIISLVSYDDGKPACIHRTYLDAEGNKLKMTIDDLNVPTKKLMARCEDKALSGGAIQFEQPETILHVAEGIETAFSVKSVQSEPVWSCVSATLLAKLNPPESVTHVFIWADKDRMKKGKCAGLIAAMELVERMEKKGVNATILMPLDDIPEHASSVDWNDVLTTQGRNAFPSISQYLWQ